MSAVLGALATCPGSARAEEESPSPVSLEWTAPDVCPARREVLDSVARTLGKTRGDPIEARVLVEGQESDWRAHIKMLARGESSTRDVEGRSCREVADALVLIVALAVSGEVAARPPSASEIPSPLNEPPPLPADPLAPKLLSAPTRWQPHREVTVEERRGRLSVAWFLGGSISFDSGSLPSLGIGGRMDFALRISRVELDVSAAFLGSEAATIVGKSTEGSSFTLLDARAGACFLALYTTRWSLGPCARIGPEAIFAKGFGSDQPANVTAVVLAPSFGLLGEAMLTSHVGLRLVLDAEIPLTRPDFFIAEGASSRQGVFTLPVIAARGSLGAVVRF